MPPTDHTYLTGVEPRILPTDFDEAGNVEENNTESDEDLQEMLEEQVDEEFINEQIQPTEDTPIKEFHSDYCETPTIPVQADEVENGDDLFLKGDGLSLGGDGFSGDLIGDSKETIKGESSIDRGDIFLCFRGDDVEDEDEDDEDKESKDEDEEEEDDGDDGGLGFKVLAAEEEGPGS
ncbi:sodium/potassium/calcium exchanger 1-like [Macrosteles quadrilineatus]|uniref:sodium/potassium/calcium exchanger 1-like n=1 Tax=Macrosteles quadrilineatus TaxID=74068 RepID=UPI0023E306EC|nr:sodium/potassium/calcium exchanger 1-like [Macrosteles quadrilineatus]